MEDRKGDYYQLPIAREDIHFLASWEDLARHEEALLQVGGQLWGSVHTMDPQAWLWGPPPPPPPPHPNPKKERKQMLRVKIM